MIKDMQIKHIIFSLFLAPLSCIAMEQDMNSLFMLSSTIPPFSHTMDQKSLPYVPEKAQDFVTSKPMNLQPTPPKDKTPLNFVKKPLSLSLFKVPVFETPKEELSWTMNVSMNKGKIRPGISLNFKYM